MTDARAIAICAEVERLTEENARLRKALRPFAEFFRAELWTDFQGMAHMYSQNGRYLDVGDFRRAVKAMEGGQNGAGPTPDYAAIRHAVESATGLHWISNGDIDCIIAACKKEV